MNHNYDKNKALNKHKELLIEKRERLDGLINLIDKTIKGDTNMSFKEFDNSFRGQFYLACISHIHKYY